MRRFRFTIGGLFLAALTVASAQGASAGPVRIQAPNDPIRMGQVNNAGATETVVRSTVIGDKATLALFNDASPGDADTLRAFAGAGPGAAIQAFAGAGTFSRAPFGGIAIRGTGTQIGVYGRSPVMGVFAEGSAPNAIGVNAVGRAAGPGVRADGDDFGVSATAEGAAVFGREDCSVPNPNACNGVMGSATLGVGVLGFATNGTATALESRGGMVKFSTAGIAVVPTGMTRVTVPSPHGIDINADTKVLVTAMSGGGTFRFVERDFAADTLTFRLQRSAANNVTLAYFIIS